MLNSDKTGNVRAAALEAWGNVMNNRVGRYELQWLTNLVTNPLLASDRRFMRAVIAVTAKLAEEGGSRLVHWFAQHADPEVRKEMAERLRFDADDGFLEKRAILTALLDDPDAGVRAAAVGGLGEHNDEAAIVHDLAQRSLSDPAPEVQAACLSALTLAHYHGFADLVFSTFEQHLSNPHVKVRKELAESCHWLPTDPRLTGLVDTLLSDVSPEVRRAMAWQGCNMGEHPELGELFMRACDDPDEGVAKDALRGMGRLMGVDQAAQLYRHRMGVRPTESTHWGVYHGIYNDLEEPAARALMQELTRSHFADVARSAREALEALEEE